MDYFDTDNISSVTSDRVTIIPENDEFLIEFPNDLDAAFRMYTESPAVKVFVDNELKARQKYIHECEPRASHYAVRGMLYDLLGEDFSVGADDINRMRDYWADK